MKHEHNMNCRELLNNLNDFIDGELDRQLCRDIEAHVESCPDCQIVVNTLKKTIKLYKTTGQETTLPEDVRMRLYARLNLDINAENE